MAAMPFDGGYKLFTHFQIKLLKNTHNLLFFFFFFFVLTELRNRIPKLSSMNIIFNGD